MMLVEIIVGKETGDEALAAALDYVRAIKKTPIVVNDSRGFFANRCVTAYLREGHLMLAEGVPPAMIDNVARMAGMPVGPLALNDEVGLDLGWRVVQATRKDLGEDAVDPDQAKLLEEMVVKRERLGRKNGKGFYDYKGRDKALWPGISDIFAARSAEEFSVEELKQRLLVVQALEAARTVEEGVVTDPRSRFRPIPASGRAVYRRHAVLLTHGREGLARLRSAGESTRRFYRPRSCTTWRRRAKAFYAASPRAANRPLTCAIKPKCLGSGRRRWPKRL